MYKRQNNLFGFFWRLFHIFISLICALIFATTDGNMTCSKCFQNCNPFLNLELSSLLKKYLIPLIIRLPPARAALSHHWYQPLLAAREMGTPGTGNSETNRASETCSVATSNTWSTTNKETHGVSATSPWLIVAIVTLSTIAKTSVEGLLRLCFYSWNIVESDAKHHQTNQQTTVL